MQPESSEANQIVNLPIETSVQFQYQDFHHGRPQDQHLQQQQQCSSRFPRGKEGGNDSPVDDGDEEKDNKTRDADADGELPGNGLRGLNSRESTTPPRKAYSPVNRITQYERAFSSPSPPRKDVGPAFKVVGKGKAEASDIPASIYRFPNEVLTHMLSHLSPSSLSSVALVSRRFYSLVTTPHAWRIAFSRFFPGPDAPLALVGGVQAQPGIPSEAGAYGHIRSSDNVDDEVRSEHRVFTRLTALASWRSEYILRTRLLRSLARGKPADGPGNPSLPRSSSSHSPPSVVTYNSQLGSSVNHLHGSFGTGPLARYPRFIHGADDVGVASTSNLHAGRADNWGLSDPREFVQFDVLDPGYTPWGLGPGDIVAVPNVMDLSQPFGMVYGEGFPGGQVYFRSSEEMRGRYLTASAGTPTPELGIPKIASLFESICSVWIAKSSNIRLVADGLVDMLAGSSYGVLTAYSFGGNGLSDPRLGRGEVTCRWMLCPGVPIISIQVDDSYSIKRRTQGRIWAVVLNALGEVFCLNDTPKRRSIDHSIKMDEDQILKLAWETGRSVYWSLIEPTRRAARVDPYGDTKEDWSYSPRSSWNGMNLTTEQLVAETQEIAEYLAFKPMHFRKVCEGWDMRRRLEVDFAGDDVGGGGEAVFVFSCALDEGNIASIKRFARCKDERVSGECCRGGEEGPYSPPSCQPRDSLFGGASSIDTARMATPSTPRSPSVESDPACHSWVHGDVERWQTTDLSLPNLKSAQITATAIDMSTYALPTTSEDPLLGMSSRSAASSPLCTPLQRVSQPTNSSDVPGQRARFVAAGTATGVVLVWNMRGPISRTAEMVNALSPVRIIHTDSPQISCLALSALYLVHGGNDGLVQAWDPLASNMLPIRTLNSRFSSRARRRLLQAEASIQGVGINLYAAGAICLDPDPTVLRGMVSLGTHLRYWSYSSSAADQYTSRKRRLRRGERGINSSGERFSGTGRGALADYIENEKLELAREKEYRRKEKERLAGRFGVGLLGSEEEILAYARMLSEETFRADEERKRNDAEGLSDEKAGSSDGEVWSSETVTPEGSAAGWSSVPGRRSPAPASTEDETDPDIAEAIRLSLLPNKPGQGGSSSSGPTPPNNAPLDAFPIKYVAQRSPSSSPPRGFQAAAIKRASDLDLEHALRLSLAEGVEQVEEFPALGKGGEGGSPGGKGKRRVS
ncbi:hypothetical protein FGG08_000162 [Glutinoglossum americanum]|uniref:F-box domain-containing protein n=1 Tax=Glutinoglossum americanum TaxID=1670608 RepID=A0A9P8I9M5_9PEZI|nr:hypothetical protein FGG08_000162 [Glutinoglossum americanum]